MPRMFDVVRVKGEVKTAEALVTRTKVKDFTKEVWTLHNASGWMSPKRRIEHQQRAASLIAAVPVADRKRLLVPSTMAKLEQLNALREAVRLAKADDAVWIKFITCKRATAEYLDSITNLYRNGEKLDADWLAVMEHKIAALEIEVGLRRRRDRPQER
jgi:hypothetical protein